MIVALWVCSMSVAAEIPPPNAGAQVSASLLNERKEILARERDEIKALSAKVVERPNAANAPPPLRPAETPGLEEATHFHPLPEVVPASPPHEDAQGGARTAREKAADALFALAGRAAAAAPPRYSLADECLRSVLERRPDHPEARRLLGFAPYRGGWATPFAIAQLGKGQVTHPTFGWIDASWVSHLEGGELPAPSGGGQRKVVWLPAAESDRRHGTWPNRWRIFTEHFVVETDVPFAEAIAFGRQLETFRGLFFSLMADLLGTENRLPLAQRFRDAKMVGELRSDPHLVYDFKGKAEYLEYLSRVKGPGLEQSLGLYDPPKLGQGKRAPAYFFRDPGGEIDAAATLYHEVSHQLLFETAGRNAYDKNVGNYWVFEGLGTYFETVVAEPDGDLLVGGRIGPRYLEAQFRLLDRREFVPTAEFVQLGLSGFNREESVHLHYAEALALTRFLMQTKGGIYREPFLDYARDAYRGRLKRDTGRSLAARLGISYDELDAEFLGDLKRNRLATVPRAEGAD